MQFCSLYGFIATDCSPPSLLMCWYAFLVHCFSCSTFVFRSHLVSALISSHQISSALIRSHQISSALISSHLSNGTFHCIATICYKTITVEIIYNVDLDILLNLELILFWNKKTITHCNNVNMYILFIKYLKMANASFNFLSRKKNHSIGLLSIYIGGSVLA